MKPVCNGGLALDLRVDVVQFGAIMTQRRWTGIILATALILGGCESVKSRIKERETVYNGWSPMTQTRVAGGEIKPGDSYDMVYIALGKPGELETFSVKDGGVMTIWSYPKITHRHLGDETVNYEDVSEYDVRTGQRIHYQIPVREGVYRTTKQRGLQVIFRDGKVTSVRWGSDEPPAKEQKVDPQKSRTP